MATVCDRKDRRENVPEEAATADSVGYQRGRFRGQWRRYTFISTHYTRNIPTVGPQIDNQNHRRAPEHTPIADKRARTHERVPTQWRLQTRASDQEEREAGQANRTDYEHGPDIEADEGDQGSLHTAPHTARQP